MKILNSLVLISLLLHLSNVQAKMRSGYSLIDLSSQKIVQVHNASIDFPPASVLKLISAYYILKNSQDLSYQTKVFADGKVSNNILKGKLILMGGGDPYLTLQNIVSLVQQVKKNNIHQVTGPLVCDGSLFDLRSEISQIGLEDQPDNPSISGLNLEFNRYKYLKAYQSFHPPLKMITKLNKNSSQNGLKFKYASNSSKVDNWIIHSKEPMKRTEELPTKNSTLFTCEYFKYIANLHGLKISSSSLVNKSTATATLVASHMGLPIRRLVQLTLEYSNNVMAESLLLKTTQQKSITASIKKMIKWYKLQFPHLKWDNINILNGSGLTTQTQIKPAFLSELLKNIYNDEESDFISYLPINAHSGSIRKRFLAPELAARVYAKSGSLYYVNNLAGYFIANSGKMFSFSYFLTDEEKRKTLDNGNSKKSNQLRKDFKKWYSNSTQIMDKKIREWIKKY